MIEKARLGRDFHLSIIKTDLHLAGSKFLFLYEGLQNLTQGLDFWSWPVFVPTF